jgi:AraC-like DNA-binding protein
MAGFRQVLESLSELSGLSLCVHDLIGFTRGGGGRHLPKRFRVHSSGFCSGIKKRLQHLCYRDDFRRANARAAELRRPFIKRCHAGVTEIVVPVLLRGVHAGTIFAGPVREKGHRVRHASGRGPLQVRSAEDLRRLGKLISVIAGYAASAGEALMLQEMESRARSEPVRRALRLAAEGYAVPLTVADAAREATLSASRFAHVFSEEMGLPFHKYLQTVRLEAAKSLLAGSSLKIIDVAARCGFCNQNYFASVFKGAVGATPREYRRTQQESADI